MKFTYHILVCKLVAEESGTPGVLDRMLSGGLCGIVGTSECGSCRDFPLVFLFLVLAGCSCVVVCTPSVGILDNESPRRGLIKAACGGVKRFTTVPSEGNVEEDWIDAWMPSKIPG